MNNRIRNQGYRWIRVEKRLAIYHRDDFRCVYCGERPEHLQLDHVQPNGEGGSNDPDNLVTACDPCNNAKGDRSIGAWCLLLEAQGDAARAAEIRASVARQTFLPIDLAVGKAIEARRTRGAALVHCHLLVDQVLAAMATPEAAA